MAQLGDLVLAGMTKEQTERHLRPFLATPKRETPKDNTSVIEELKKETPVILPAAAKAVPPAARTAGKPTKSPNATPVASPKPIALVQPAPIVVPAPIAVPDPAQDDLPALEPQDENKVI